MSIASCFDLVETVRVAIPPPTLPHPPALGELLTIVAQNVHWGDQLCLA